MIAFGVGVAVAVAAFGYSAVYRYRNLSRRLDETRVDRLSRVFGPVAWGRVLVIALLTGGVTHVAWHGLGDVLATLAGWSP